MVEGVTVGRGIRDALGARHAAGAADVLDYDLLAEDFAHPLPHYPAKHVGWAAGREWNNHRHRPRWIRLGQRYGGECEHDATCRTYALEHVAHA